MICVYGDTVTQPTVHPEVNNLFGILNRVRRCLPLLTLYLYCHSVGTVSRIHHRIPGLRFYSVSLITTTVRGGSRGVVREPQSPFPSLYGTTHGWTSQVKYQYSVRITQSAARGYVQTQSTIVRWACVRRPVMTMRRHTRLFYRNQSTLRKNFDTCRYVQK